MAFSTATYWVDCITCSKGYVTSYVCLCPSNDARSCVTTQGADWGLSGSESCWTDTPPRHEARVTSHYLLSPRWPQCLSARHFGSKTHQFACALNAAATIKLKLILLTFNRTAMASNIACAPHCRGLLDRGPVDVCCIRSKVTDCTTLPPPLLFSFSPPPLHPLSPVLDPALVFWCLFPHFHIGKILNTVGWISTPGWGLYTIAFMFHCIL